MAKQWTKRKALWAREFVRTGGDSTGTGGNAAASARAAGYGVPTQAGSTLRISLRDGTDPALAAYVETLASGVDPDDAPTPADSLGAIIDGPEALRIASAIARNTTAQDGMRLRALEIVMRAAGVDRPETGVQIDVTAADIRAQVAKMLNAPHLAHPAGVARETPDTE